MDGGATATAPRALFPRPPPYPPARLTAEECWFVPLGSNASVSGARRYGRLASAACNLPCPGNPLQTCGGHWAFDLYELC